MRPLKLLFIVHSFSLGGGAEKILSNLITELDRRGGYEISLMEIHHHADKWEYLPPSVKVVKPVLDESVSSPFARVKRGLDRRVLGKSPEEMRAAFRDDAPYDLVVSFNYQIPSFLVKPEENSISWNHGSIEDLADDEVRREYQRQAYAHFDRIVAIAERTRASIVNLFPEFEDKVRLVHNGFRFDEIQSRAAESYSGLNSPKSILALGRLDENKNPLFIIDCFKAINERHADCHLHFVGTGDLSEQAQQHAVELGLSECVHLHGFQPNPYPFIKDADCIMSLSHSEGFQTVLVEGLCLGTPFISTPVGAAEELSDGGRFGWVIQSPDQAVDAYDQILALRADAKFSDEMSAFVSQFSLASQADGFEELVREIMAEREV